MDLTARTRYSGAALIITVPMRVRKKIGLKPGDEVEVKIRKKVDDKLVIELHSRK